MTQTWWLSFCDPEKPAGQQFLGVAIVDVDETDALRAEGTANAIRATHHLPPLTDPSDRMMAAAIWKSHRQRCNPGGAVAACRVDELAPPQALATCPRNRLLSRAELEALDVIGTSLDGDQ